MSVGVVVAESGVEGAVLEVLGVVHVSTRSNYSRRRSDSFQSTF